MLQNGGNSQALQGDNLEKAIPTKVMIFFTWEKPGPGFLAGENLTYK